MSSAVETRSFESRKIELAILEAQDAIKTNPNNWEAYYNLANIYYSQKEYKQAEELYQKILAAGNKGYNLYRGLGNVHFAQKHYKEAAQIFEKAVDLNYKDPESHYALALAYEKLGNDELFVQECTRALVVDKNFARAHYSMGFHYAGQKKYDQAIRELEKAVKISPAYPEAHFQLMQLYMLKKQPKEAMREAVETLKYNPKHVPAHYQLGLFAEQFQDHVTAVREFIEVQKLDNTYPGIEEKIAAALQKEEAKYQQEISGDPRATRPYLALADLYFEAGKLDVAARLCEKVLSIDKANVTARINMGVIYASVEKYIKAISEYKKALRADPDNKAIRENLNLAFRLGLQYYRDKVQKNPRDNFAWDSLLIIHQEKGDYISLVETYAAKMECFKDNKRLQKEYVEFGRNYLKQAVAEMKKDSQQVYQVGLAYWAQDDLDAAEKVFRIIVDNHPRDARAIYLLGRTLDKKGNIAQAMQYLQIAYHLNPSFRDTFIQIKNICTRKVEDLKQKLKGTAADAPYLLEIAEINNNQQVYDLAVQYLDALRKLTPDNKEYQEKYYIARTNLKNQLQRFVEQGVGEIEYYMKLGALYEEDATLSKAIAVYQRGAELFPLDGRLRERLIEASKKAIAEFEKYLKKEPDHAEVQYALASFAATVGYQLKALDALQKAVRLKPVFAERARNAAEFKELRLNPKFQEIIHGKATTERISQVVE